MNSPAALLHVDLDSPATLLRFWGNAQNEKVDLEHFYKTALSRALELFAACEVPATFFCVGQELQGSPAFRDQIQKAHRQGHEIANHTQTHPFGLRTLDPAQIRREIEACSQVITEVTGVRPAGFRAPSYEMDEPVLGILEALGFQYDSSAFWSVLQPAMRLYYRMFKRTGNGQAFGGGSISIPREPYWPSAENWMRPGPRRAILELPLPRSSLLHVPFYFNFHLQTGAFFRKMALGLMQEPFVAYLFHGIEFVDLQDGLPNALRVHPGVAVPVKQKLAAMREIILTFKKRYRIPRTLDFVQQYGTAKDSLRGKAATVLNG